MPKGDEVCWGRSWVKTQVYMALKPAPPLCHYTPKRTYMAVANMPRCHMAMYIPIKNGGHLAWELGEWLEATRII